MENLKLSRERFKKLYSLMGPALLATLLFCACNNSSERQQKNIDDLNAYVQAHRDSIDAFVHRDWNTMDSEFAAKRKDIERDTAKMSETLRASYYDAVRNWEAFQSAYTIRQSEDAKLGEMDNIRKSLSLDGVRTDFTDLTAPQLLAAYEHFVNTVRDNKDIYTREQWTVVNVSWKALNGRKRELEKDIDAGLSGKITKLQLQYTGIKALNRPLADNP